MTVEELRIVISANGSASYGTQMRQVTQATNNFKTSIAATMSTLAKLLSAGLIAKFAKECVNAASDLQEVANVTNVTFGAMAETVNQWAKTQAASFGLSETAAKRYVGSFGTMAKQFGMTTEQAANMGIALTKLTGDVASFYNLDNATAYTKLKSVFTGETESLKELGVVMTEAQLNAYALEKGINKQVKSMTEGEKVLLRYSFVTDKLSHAQGDFARTSDGWANSVRTFQLQLENLKIQIGNELLPVAGYGLSLINKGLQFISPMLIGVAKTVKAYTEAWKNADGVTKAFVKTSIGIVAVMVIAPKIIGFVSAAVKLLTMEITTLAGALTAISGIISILLVGLAFARMKKQIDNNKESAEELGTTVENTALNVEDLADSVDGLSDSAKGLDLFLASFDEVNKVGGGSSLMSGLVNDNDIKNILAATAGIEDLGAAAQEASNTKITLNLPTWEDIKKYIKNILKQGKEYIESGQWKIDISKLITNIDQFIEKNFPKLHKFMTDIGTTAAEIVESIGKTITEVKQQIEEFVDSVSGFLDHKEIKGKITDDDKNAFQSKYGIAQPSDTSLIGPTMPGSSKTQVTSINPTINVNPDLSAQIKLEIDGRKITDTVIEHINNRTRSSGSSPLIELG